MALKPRSCAGMSLFAARNTWPACQIAIRASRVWDQDWKSLDARRASDSPNLPAKRWRSSGAACMIIMKSSARRVASGELRVRDGIRDEKSERSR